MSGYEVTMIVLGSLSLMLSMLAFVVVLVKSIKK
ncbi:hypothetical protein LGMK_06170 [Leuconostoc sp. C2]|uniref:Holin-like toxin n=1 Tax=Leuconostoc kimchii (strain IMSNU 11154 / KCTC 2386 / IH25) TaxID=762051 RepID=D5T385_LEUKI|nr:hypothetical protein LKI_05970 [Leuconostoc kimchii IMSNU 11154]AEJ31291.1 hypothetical protein LGMK_06170 [Leuconostoc sp. C2]